MPKKDHKKKKSSKKQPPSAGEQRKNPKAFNVANVVRTKRTQQRNMDRAQKKELVPLVDRTEELPPPSVVVIMGPKGCGKSTLIRSLVKIYTGQNLSDTKGPITVVAGKKKRITFFECPLDLYSMTDLAKVADLVLLMVDASYGFEMETFEFLNQLQLHGFPKVLGVLSHLDKFRTNKQLQAQKKALKHRFWTEIYKGAKLFEFMGVVNGKYMKHEVKRLSQYISRVKFRPLVWRNSHPYVMVDRVEDVTPVERMQQQGAHCDRDVTLYGYVRGTHLKPGVKVHLIGVGDFDLSAVSALPDPCPLPRSSLDAAGGMSVKSLKSKKDSLLYAPMANVGRVTMDRDGLYIDIKNVHYTKKDHLHLSEEQRMSLPDYGAELGREGGDHVTPMEMLRRMQDVPAGASVDQQLFSGSTRHSTAGAGLTMFGHGEDGSEASSSGGDSEGSGNDENDDEEKEEDDDEEDSEDDDDDEEDMGDEEDVAYMQGLEGYDDEDDDEEEEEDAKNEQKRELPRNLKGTDGFAKSALDPRQQDRSSSTELSSVDLMQLVYGSNWAAATSSSSVAVAKPNGGYAAEATTDVGDDEGDDELFAVKTSVDSWRGAGGLSKSMIEYYCDNRVDSSRTTSVADSSGPTSRMAMGMFAGKSGSTRESLAVMTPVEREKELAKMAEVDKFTALEGRGATTASTPETSNWWYQTVKSRFVTAGYGSAGSASGANANAEGSDDENFGTFEDLQTGEVFSNGAAKSGAGHGDSSAEEDDEEGLEQKNNLIDAELRQMHAARKASFKAKFDSNYDAQKSKGGKKGSGDGLFDDADGEVEQKGDDDSEDDGLDEEDRKFLEAAKRIKGDIAERNRMEFAGENESARALFEGGFRQGAYVRILLRDVPAEFTANFRPQLPVVLGGLLAHEMKMGFINARVKRHRWHKRVLKSNDPVTFSIGWRRFQSIPVYTMVDQNDRARYLKYTPEHMHCTASFYGPLVAPNTPILAFQKVSHKEAAFRISFTGVALEQQATPEVVKKLKLVGTPTKVFKNTAFVTGMFNSALEVAKFEHSKLKTVSGIRGAIKKAVQAGAPGTFRASFEDKILMSDIIVCRLWVPVEIKAFYNPVLSLLDKDEAAEGAQVPAVPLMRTLTEIRKAELIPQPVNKDSVYKPIVRKERVFKALKLPAKLQEALPFASKPKQTPKQNPKSYLARRAPVVEPEERASRAVVQMLHTIKKSKQEIRAAAQTARTAAKRATKARETERFEDVHKYEKKRKYRDEGKETARRLKKMQG